ncbi:MAG TPA: small ribosomal subunit Rsm22 family protein [Xanthobacteraceae bacterium]|jgi:ribosomal protein RSM22 (predicted rRNA methylase)|nr:small ribosomal subunit Rsm22 family protein [Xanthobacteraceae bacterium]
MELPPLLRRAVDRALSGVPTAELATASAALSQRYRDERRDGKLYVQSRQDALAYLAVRLPATYAAARASFAAVTEARPDFMPKSVLDAGAGPGTAVWAAADCWPGLDAAWLVEASPAFRACGETLVAEIELPRVSWRIIDIGAQPVDCPPCDLVIMAYTLNELAAEVRQDVLRQLWELTAGVLVIVEPGTPAGWQRIVAARRVLIESGAHVIAPCPHACACPLQLPDWCHFAERVARSRLHRQVKNTQIAWEDEKFSYVAVSHTPTSATAPRVIARPRKAGGRVTLKLCRPDGSASEQLFSRRDGALFKLARRKHWGSAF